jgi:SAM-dependent methyltransferase
MVVETAESDCPDHPFALSHKKIQFSNPSFWCTAQFLDAFKTQFTLDLHLRRYNYQLKDALPENFSFDHGVPKLVDFSSILHKSRISSSEWVREAKQNLSINRLIFESMTLPFFLIPIFLILIGDTAGWRESITRYFCNSGRPGLNLSRSLDIITIGRKGKIFFLFWYSLSKLIGFSNNFHLHFFFFSLIYRLGNRNNLKNTSHYSDYYSKKNESSPLTEEQSWNNKQLSVKNALLENKITSVTDLGCNTGWFSIMAANLGYSVKSCDIDNASLNQLYLESKERCLDLEISQVSFSAIMHAALNAGPELTRDFRPEWIESDCLIVLGLIHHLVLGDGHSFQELFQVFSILSPSLLLVEFIELNDTRIVEEPTFFQALNTMVPRYNMKEFITAGRLFYNSVKIKKSFPDSRKIVIFEN